MRKRGMASTAVWPHCGHPRTKKNTSGQYRPRCRICQQDASARSYERRRGRIPLNDGQRALAEIRAISWRSVPTPISDSGRSYTLAPTRKVG